MISLSTKTTKTIFAAIIIISIGLVIATILTSCSSRHITILNEITKFEQSLDPELCEDIVYKIDIFNDECEPDIEIIDCG